MLSIKEFAKYQNLIEKYYQNEQKNNFTNCKQIQEKLITTYPNYNVGYVLKLRNYIKTNEIGKLEEIFTSLVEKQILNLSLLWPFEILNKENPYYSVDIEKLFLDFLRKREKYLLSIMDNSNDYLRILKELFYIYDETRNGTKLELIARKIIEFDYNFINIERKYSANSNKSHREQFNVFFREYWDSMQGWQNSDEEKIATFAKVYSEIKNNSASLKISKIKNWESFAFSYIPKLLKAKNKIEYYEKLVEIVHKIGDDHNHLYFPFDISKQFTNPEVDIVFIQNKYYVKSDYVISGKTVINAGDKFISINGIKTFEYIKKNQNKYPFVKHYHFEPKFTAMYRLSDDLLTMKKESPISAKFQKADGSVFIYSFSKDEKNEKENNIAISKYITVRMLENNILYINIHTFMGTDIYKLFKEKLSKFNLSDISGIIFDVRENVGGLSNYGDSIFSHFIRDEVKSYFMDYNKVHIPHHKIEGFEDIKVYDSDIIQPSSEFTLDCPIVVLTSPYSGSSTEDFVFLFKFYKRGKVIGLPTAGSSGNGIDFLLQGGGDLRVNIDVSLYFSSKGIQPDIYVDYSIKDLLKGNDPQLGKALSYLNGRNCDES